MTNHIFAHRMPGHPAAFDRGIESGIAIWILRRVLARISGDISTEADRVSASNHAYHAIRCFEENIGRVGNMKSQPENQARGVERH